jgi:hypothetical protein
VSWNFRHSIVADYTQKDGMLQYKCGCVLREFIKDEKEKVHCSQSNNPRGGSMKKVYTLLIMVIISASPIAASPQLDVRIAQNAISVSAGSLASVRITYENVGDTDLQLYLFVYDDGSNEVSPRPILLTSFRL